MEAERLLATAAGLLVLAFGALGCQSDTVQPRPAEDPAQDPTQGEVRQSPPVANQAPGGAAPALPLALYRAGDAGPQALLRGELVQEEACLYVRASEGGERYLLALPSGRATWHADPAGVEVDGLLLRVGETVTLTGGETRDGLRPGDWVEAPAAACDTTLVWRVTGVQRE